MIIGEPLEMGSIKLADPFIAIWAQIKTFLSSSMIEEISYIFQIWQTHCDNKTSFCIKTLMSTK